MMFETAIRWARLTYATLMASCTCLIMSAISTAILTPTGTFWQHWPKVLGIDLMVAIPLAIILAPLIRRFCGYLFPAVRRPS